MAGRTSARAILVAGAAFGVTLATSCSLVTSLDGLSGGATGPNGGDGSVATIDGGRDGAVDTADGGDASVSTKPRVWRQLMVAGPPALHSARMAYDEKRKKIVLYGGAGAAQTADTWEWDGTAWAKASAATNPGPRNAPGVAYDGAHGVTRVYGGSTTTPDPWEFDGATWKSSGTSPSAPDVRYGSAMVYDSSRDVLVVFGGLRSISPNSPNGETWEWSTSKGFINRDPPVSPPARRGGAVVYDAARARVVVFGGVGSALLADTWEWDGTSWTQAMSPLSPAARRGPCAAFDAGRNVIVLYGGHIAGTTPAFDDTWHWNGSAWTAGPTGPRGRSACAMAYDRARDQIVMFGGSLGRAGMMPPMSLGETWVYE